jgi:hypothetical protein
MSLAAIEKRKLEAAIERLRQGNAGEGTSKKEKS